MATAHRESIGQLHDKITITIGKDDYLPSFETALKKYSKNASLPGFRKGHVPAGMIRKMYGQSVFLDEVIRTANQELEKFLQEEKPVIFAQPLPFEGAEKLNIDMNQAADYKFEFEIGLKPTFNVDLNQHKGKINKYMIQITDDMLNQEVEHIRKRAGKLSHPETSEDPEDLVYLEYERLDENGNAVDGLEKMQDVEAMKDLMAPIAELVKGKKAGESFQIQPTQLLNEEEQKRLLEKALHLSADDEEAKKANYNVTITKYGHLKAKELNKEFFNEVFPNSEIEDVDGFKAKLKEELQKELMRYSVDKLQNDIYETLVHETPIELPENFLRSWLKRGSEEEKTEEAVNKEYPQFDHQLRWNLISDQLMQEKEIKVTREEVLESVKGQMMAYFGVANEEDAPWLDSYLQRVQEDKKQMDDTYRRLLFDRLFESLEKDLEVQEKEVTQEEFNQLSQAGHHHHQH